MTKQYHPKVRTEILDHHGIVSGICKDIGLEDEINNRIGSSNPRRVVQPGKAIVAMIIAGLGFTSRRLYLTSKFFKNKPIKRLIGGQIEAEDLDDHTLGKALDEIHEYGSTKLFAEVAFAIASREKLLEGKELCHLDTTSFSLHGQYETEEEVDVIKVCKGFCKDHRPDLNQVVLSLVMMTGKANLPMWMEGLDGNSSDKTSFHKTVSQVREFQKQVRCDDFCWVADSAFYSVDKIADYTNFQWISRFPESIKSAKNILSQKEFLWTELGDGYSFSELDSSYGGINQRWLIVKSEQALKRESRTLEKKVEKEMEKASKACWHLGNESFSCEKDAEAAVKKLKRTFRYTTLSWKIDEVRKYPRKGRPREGDKKVLQGYRVVCQTSKNEEAIETELRRKGRFIIATNNIDADKWRIVVTNLDPLRQKIIRLLGRSILEIYDFADEIAGK